MPSFIEPDGRTVHGGAICRIIGATGVNKFGTEMICRVNPVNPPADGKPRWGRANPAPRSPRRRSATPRKGQGVERRYTNMFLAGNPAPEAPLPDKLVEQLDPKQIAAVRAAGGLPVAPDVKKPRRSDIEKLTVLGAIDADGKLTQRGLDALRRRGELDDTTPVDATPTPAAAAPASERSTTPSPAAAVDWNEYDTCPSKGCPAGPGQPCIDQRRARGLKPGEPAPTTAFPHKGRLKLATPLPAQPQAVPAPAAEPVQHHVVTIVGPNSAGNFGWVCACGAEADELEPSEIVGHAEGHGPLAANSPRPEACTFCGEQITDDNRSEEDRGLCHDCQTDEDNNAVPTGQQRAEQQQGVYNQFRVNGGVPGASAEDLDAALRDAARRLHRDQRSDFVGLAALRAALGDRYSRAEVDEALRRMAGPAFRVIPTANTKSLAPEDRDAAVSIGGEDSHMVQARGAGYAARHPSNEPIPSSTLSVWDNEQLADAIDFYPRGSVAGRQAEREQAERERLGVGSWQAAWDALDWSPYGRCDDCNAAPGSPCEDLRNGRGDLFITRPHPGRQKHDPAPVVTRIADQAELAAQAAYAKVLTDPDGASPDDLATALGASDMDDATRAEIQRQLTRRARPAAPNPQPDGTPRDVAPTKAGPAASGSEPTPAPPVADPDAYQRVARARGAEITDEDLSAAIGHIAATSPEDSNDRESVLAEAARRQWRPDPDAQVVTGRPSAAPLARNNWGDPEVTEGVHHFHGDGVVGTAIGRMGDDARMDVDGQPVANRAGQIATDVDLCRITPQEGADQMAALRDRLPVGSRARTALDGAVSQMRCPDFPAPVVDERVPEPIRTLIHDLHHDVPMVRITGRETGRLVEVAELFIAGDNRHGGLSLINQVQQAAGNVTHESNGDRGKRYIDHRVRRAVEELHQLRKTNRTALYPPTEEGTR